MTTDTAQKIIKYIHANKNSRPYDLIKFLGISEVAVHKQLKKLISKDILRKVGSSPHVFYYLAPTVQNIKAEIIPILKRAGVTKAAIFGSYARGDYHAKSDVDILVTVPKTYSLLDLVHLEHQLENKAKKDIDLVTYNSINPRIQKYVYQDIIPLI